MNNPGMSGDQPAYYSGFSSQTMKKERPKIVIITGPTSSGKSSLAVDLALRLGGEIINIDSMQVYRGMDIGTAKPDIEERKGIPHHMFDVVDPDGLFNASIYRSMTIPIIRDIAKRKAICFIVGGTGLYIKTLLGGLLECPPVNPDLRIRLEKEYDEQGSLSLHVRLEALDPDSARNIHPNDRVRVIRALEIIELTDQPLSTLIERHEFRDRPFQFLKICLRLDREEIYRRIDRRSISMIETGLVEETRGLLERGYSSGLQPMKSLGYRHAVAFLQNDYDKNEMISHLQRDTRRYAKRQLTWFRADPEMIWVDPDKVALVEKKISEFISSE